MLISKPFIPPFVEEYWIAHFMLTVMEDSTVIYFFEGLLGIMRQQRTEEHREALLAVADAVRECAEGKDPEARDDLTRAEENTRYAEAALRNPNRQAAIRFIERAVGNLEKAVIDEILEEEQGILFMLDLMFIARSISIEIVDQAIAHPNGDEDAIFEAQMALAEGDSLGYSYNPHLTFMKAVDKYRDALIKAESILLN